MGQDPGLIYSLFLSPPQWSSKLKWYSQRRNGPKMMPLPTARPALWPTKPMVGPGTTTQKNGPPPSTPTPALTTEWRLQCAMSRIWRMASRCLVGSPWIQGCGTKPCPVSRGQSSERGVASDKASVPSDGTPHLYKSPFLAPDCLQQEPHCHFPGLPQLPLSCFPPLTPHTAVPWAMQDQAGPLRSLPMLDP